MESRLDDLGTQATSLMSGSTGSFFVYAPHGSNSLCYLQGWPLGLRLHHREPHIRKACLDPFQPGYKQPTDLLDVAEEVNLAY